MQMDMAIKAQSEKDNFQLNVTSAKEQLDYYECFWSLNNDNGASESIKNGF
jgi:hypothetical protein